MTHRQAETKRLGGEQVTAAKMQVGLSSFSIFFFSSSLVHLPSSLPLFSPPAFSGKPLAAIKSPITTMNEPKIYKGIDLLDKIFEFVEMTPNSNLWTVNAQKENQPRLIRLKQINSLLSAFFQTNKPNGFIDKAKQLFSENKNETIQTILSGDFLIRQNIIEFSELIKLIKAMVYEKEKVEREEREINIRQLKIPYQQLIEYKQQIRKLLTFNSGFLEVSSETTRFSIYLTNSISNNLKDKYSDLDNALELFINPKKLSFTEYELIDKYNFPKENLHEIDIDNW